MSGSWRMWKLPAGNVTDTVNKPPAFMQAVYLLYAQGRMLLPYSIFYGMCANTGDL